MARISQDFNVLLKPMYLPEGTEWGEILNPKGVFPEREIVPLGLKSPTVPSLQAIVCDMDGTTTTTEVLCIHSLETMVRRITGRLDLQSWAGLTPDDYPHIIGNSTTRHVEYLLNQYRPHIQPALVADSFLNAAFWFFAFGRDARRVAEVAENFKRFTGISRKETELSQAISQWQVQGAIPKDALAHWKAKLLKKMQIEPGVAETNAAIDIYYQRYHEILNAIDDGQPITGFGDGEASGSRFISPMPGVALFLALIKGWLPENSQSLLPLLKPAELDMDVNMAEENWVSLMAHFRKSPVKIALVTSSIFWEADIVMRQLFAGIREELAAWHLGDKQIHELQNHFSHYEAVYDAFVTASDSHEIRLKPHRDLYSIALRQMGVKPEDFNKVVGFEDSASGIFAIRAAGVGCAVALPFHQTANHNFSPAAHILKGALPEAILCHQLFLKNLNRREK
jgi:beta-phosphoglucomutase-like phosphatase (HAD superfamily)